MDYTNYLDGVDASYLASLFAMWKEDPSSVNKDWQKVFSKNIEDMQSIIFELERRDNYNTKPALDGAFLEDVNDLIAIGDKPKQDINKITKQALLDTVRALMLIRTWRVRGHLVANLDPLCLHTEEIHPELEPKFHGFNDDDWNRPIFINYYLGKEYATLAEIMDILQGSYGKTMGVEFMHISEPDKKSWLQERFESMEGCFTQDKEKSKQIFKTLVDAEELEKTLARRFTGVKRFGLEGGETTLVAMEEIFATSSKLDVKEVVIGMPHRGRLNVLVNMLKKPFAALVAEFLGTSSKPVNVQGSGDVKYHLGASADREYDGKSIHLSLAANPSHLEAVNPVVVGKVRAKQDRNNDVERKSVMGVLLHGDAAFAGQGIVSETLLMSELTGYETGGTIHIIVNNQIGFTTLPVYSRSSTYCSDVAKTIQCPILHVNGDDPEAVLVAAKIATEYRHKFGSDIVIDIVCYRRRGHNEGDEPKFTQPIMYKTIEKHPTVVTIFKQLLIDDRNFDEAELDSIISDTEKSFDEGYYEGQDWQPSNADWFQDRWKGLIAPSEDSREDSIYDTDTSVAKETLKKLGKAINTIPSDFAIHKKIKIVFDKRLQAIEKEDEIDWANAESLAFASLLNEGIGIRLSGEDSSRGTFSHRHAAVIDQESEQKYIPLKHIKENQARFEVWDSPLSEYGVLGFEYGYAAAEPWKLVIWEAQFGDFANGAQIIIDQFISSSESKWLRMCGLVMLLPHGYEGQGPEHSSARLERYLQLCAQNNMHVVYPTTPANYFHLLRRQIKRNFRKPLIVMSPKSPLRNKNVVSKLDEMSKGSEFLRVIKDQDKLVENNKVKKVLFCSGKVYWDLLDYRRNNDIKDIAIIRIEQIYPFPWDLLGDVVKQYTNAEFLWVQEETANGGAWIFVQQRFNNLFEDLSIDKKIYYVGRYNMASPAVGLISEHKKESEMILKYAFELEVLDIPQPFKKIRQWKKV